MSETKVDTFPGSRPAQLPGNGAPSGENVHSTSAAPLLDQAKDQAHEIAEKTQHAAGQVLGQAKDHTRSWAEDRKEAVAQSLRDVADTVLEGGESLRRRNPETYGKFAEIAERAAEVVDNASGYLQKTSVDQMVSEIERAGRQSPMIFLVGTAALGFMAARFFKSSGRGAGSAPGYNPDRSLPVVQSDSAGFQSGGHSPSSDHRSPDQL